MPPPHQLALVAGRKLQSSQTGWIHLHYHQDPPHLAIPIYENFLFVLALFRSRLADPINEGKVIFETLLRLQGRDGNFPIYMHEFPNCKDKWLGPNVLAPLYRILQNFHQVLGSELRKEAETAAKTLLHYCISNQLQKKFPFQLEVKIASAAKAFGAFFEDQALMEMGSLWLNELADRSEQAAWGCPASLGEMAVALQMAYPALSGSPWKQFPSYLANNWHPGTATYIGPAVKEFQEGYEPQVTLYDLYMGYAGENFSSRALASAPHHLHGALIYPVDEKLPFCDWEGPLAYSCLEREEGWNPAADNAFIPLKMVWGSSDYVHTLVCQGGNSLHSSFEEKKGEIELYFTLAAKPETEDKEGNREVVFFLDRSDKHKITIAGVPGNTFQVGDEVCIQSERVNISIQFHIEEGSGRFQGHIMPGNRPSQISLKGPNRYSAYDWQIFLRTVRREENCRICARIRWEDDKRE